jgi:hypothetical protein
MSEQTSIGAQSAGDQSAGQTTQQTAAQNAIHQAVQAIRRGDRTQARRWASLAARLDSSSEVPWLIMASLAAPAASVAYLNIALERNPKSVAARRGMHWAITRLRKAAHEGQKPAQHLAAANIPTVPSGLPSVIPEGIDRPTQPARLHLVRLPPGERTQPVHLPVGSRRRPAFTWAIVILLVVFAGLFLAGAAGSYMVMARSNTAERGISMMFKPSLTPTNSPTPTPTNTPTPTPTPTETPTPTDTPTPIPTDTPLPTDTPVPTEPPPPTDEPGPVFAGLPDGVGAGERWIDVDLTNQRTFAYEGSTLVNSFVVSTGTWQHPTVTGTYKVYVKYRYADMRGPGYYLADVPYVMYFYQGYGLHGTYWHHNFGTPMSHGCINLTIGEAGWLFDWASVGTVVHIHY